MADVIRDSKQLIADSIASQLTYSNLMTLYPKLEEGLRRLKNIGKGYLKVSLSRLGEIKAYTDILDNMWLATEFTLDKVTYVRLTDGGFDEVDLGTKIALRTLIMPERVLKLENYVAINFVNSFAYVLDHQQLVGDLLYAKQGEADFPVMLDSTLKELKRSYKDSLVKWYGTYFMHGNYEEDAYNLLRAYMVKDKDVGNLELRDQVVMIKPPQFSLLMDGKVFLYQHYQFQGKGIKQRVSRLEFRVKDDRTDQFKTLAGIKGEINYVLFLSLMLELTTEVNSHMSEYYNNFKVTSFGLSQLVTPEVLKQILSEHELAVLNQPLKDEERDYQQKQRLSKWLENVQTAEVKPDKVIYSKYYAVLKFFNGNALLRSKYPNLTLYLSSSCVMASISGSRLVCLYSGLSNDPKSNRTLHDLSVNVAKLFTDVQFIGSLVKVYDFRTKHFEFTLASDDDEG